MVDHDTTVLRSGNLYNSFLPCCGEFLFSKLTVWKARCLRNILLRVVMDCLSPLLAASPDHQTGGNLSIRMTEGEGHMWRLGLTTVLFGVTFILSMGVVSVQYPHKPPPQGNCSD